MPFFPEPDNAKTSRSGGELLRHAVDLYKPSHVFALFSGGHDSLVATHSAMETGLVDAVVHCNTGIGVEATRAFVRETCARYGWRLIEVRAKEDCGQDYWEWVEQYGFPGPAQHGRMYQRLKERCLRHVERRHRQYARANGRRRRIPILYVSGCRSEESTRRMGTVEPIQYRLAEGRVWCAIYHDHTGTDQHRYMTEHGLPRNPVKDKMCMSGECLCGAFSRRGELDEWVYHFGDDPGILELLRRRIEVLKRHGYDWDQPPPTKRNAGAGFGLAATGLDVVPEKRQMLCSRCLLRDDIAKEQERKEACHNPAKPRKPSS